MASGGQSELDDAVTSIIGLGAAVKAYVNTRRSGLDAEEILDVAVDLGTVLEGLGEIIVLSATGEASSTLPDGTPLGIDGLPVVDTELTEKSKSAMIAFLTGDSEELPRITTRLALQRAHQLLADGGVGWSRKRREKFETAVMDAEDKLEQRAQRRKDHRR